MTARDDWLRSNQLYLVAYLDSLRYRLEHQTKKIIGMPENRNEIEEAETRLENIRNKMESPPALEVLGHTFGLSEFELDTLMLCAGMEMDGRFAPLCAILNDDPSMNYPTFNLALSHLSGPHWSAVIGSGPLRSWWMVELGKGVANNLSVLRIDETILDFLVGMKRLDTRLDGMVEQVRDLNDIPPSMMNIVDRASRIWISSFKRGEGQVIELCGGDWNDRRALAAAICGNVELNLFAVRSESLPQGSADLKEMAVLWEREAMLGGLCLLIETDDEDHNHSRKDSARMLSERLQTPTLISCDKPLQIYGRKMMVFDVQRPKAGEQRDYWLKELGEENKDIFGQVEPAVARFDLSVNDIISIAGEVRTMIDSSEEKGHEIIDKIVWNACRRRVRSRFDDLAIRIEPLAKWDDLVLPEEHIRTLKSMASHVRQRTKVIDEWGFASKSSRGLGTSSLFIGPSGTGKTMAAEVLANDLDLDIYRIDLSQVVSKYIGETEKNLEKVFRSADACGAILLFDEADALFGKRSEVRDSHDRYANIEVGYLLQRMEDYKGLAILTTNMRNAIDPAFLRRIRFIVNFPFPDEKARSRIWQSAFPRSTPLEGVNFAALAKMNISGGSIHNVALNAAFLAADGDQVVRTEHIMSAARAEYAKQEKKISLAEMGVANASKNG